MKYLALLAICLLAIGGGYLVSRLLIAPAPIAASESETAPPLPTSPFVGRVVSVADGDTVSVLVNNSDLHKIRLAGIDAPEHRQDFSQKAKSFLSDLVYDKEVTVSFDKIDKYGRIVGVIMIDGKDVSLALVDAGLAWHYKKYEDEQSLSDREAYATAEISARKAKRGLWSIPNPMAPWNFRHPPGETTK